MGGWRTGLVLLALMVCPVPAAADHGETPGTVTFVESDGRSYIVMTFPSGTVPDEAVERLHAAARESGIAVGSSEVEVNGNGVEVFARAVLTEKTGFLERRIPAGVVSAWRGEVRNQRLFLQRDAWMTDVQPRAARRGWIYPVDGDITYRVAPWAFYGPLAALGVAFVVPLLLGTAYARRTMARPVQPDEQLHRLARASRIIVLGVGFGLLAVLAFSGLLQWPDLMMREMLPGVLVPEGLARFASFLGAGLILLLARIAMETAVAPFARRLLGVPPEARGGWTLFLRSLALLVSPFVLGMAVASVPLEGWAGVGLIAGFLITYPLLQPLILNALLRVGPVPDPVRERVDATFEQHQFVARDVRLLPTPGRRVSNAMISGLGRRFRYVYLTDRLIEILDAEELEAVLAHEIAHGKGHHLVAQVGLGLAGLAGFVGYGWFVGERVEVDGPAMAAAVFVLMPAAILGVLAVVRGAVGVALEKRADDYAVRTVGAGTLARALDKMADDAKVKRRTSWLWNAIEHHPGVEERIERLRSAAFEPVQARGSGAG